jgi:hypothetical protein
MMLEEPMKRLLCVALLVLLALTISAEEIPIPFFAELHLISWSGVEYDRTLTDWMETPDFQYPARLALLEDGRCSFQFSNGLEFYYTWEHHPEYENVIVLITESGTSYLIFTPIPEHDIIDGSWSVVLVDPYTSWARVRTYVIP